MNALAASDTSMWDSGLLLGGLPGVPGSRVRPVRPFMTSALPAAGPFHPTAVKAREDGVA